jgi:DNA modification methylase
MPAEELLFEPTPAFGEYKPFLEHATTHPAKMNTKLIEFLVESWTKPHETVLDPMAGTGSLGVIAALHGRNAVQVELEKRFYDWMEKARENVEKTPSLAAKGWIRNINGDARHLSELLSKADIAITSPPYSNIAKSKEGAISPHMQGLISKLSGIPVKEFAHNVEKLKEAVKIAQAKIPFKYSDNPGNIGNLPHGDISAVITSPPYSESMTKKRKGYTIIPELAKTREMPQDTRNDNIANLPHGSIDLVLTSPPYADIEKRDRSRESWFNEDKEREKAGGSVTIQKGYRGNSENIGNLPLGNVDTIITSPPYVESVNAPNDPEKRAQRMLQAGLDPKKIVGGKARCGEMNWQYGQSKGQIGNLPMGEISTIITSPPYSECPGSVYEGLGGRIEGLFKEGKITKEQYEHFKGRKAYFEEAAKPYPQSNRQIANLPLGEISTIITSPPYGEAQEGSGIAKRGYQSSKHSPTDLVGKRSYMPDKFESPENISKLPYVDAVITSPPYETSVSDNKESPLVGADENKYGRWKKGTAKKHSYTQHGEPCKVDIVITSPPYADSKKAEEVKPEEVEKYAKRWEENVEKRKWNSWGKSFHTPRRLMGIKSLMDGYSNSKENIGNLTLGDIDCCITSPPYEGSLEGTTRHTRGGIASRDPALARTGSYATVMSFGVPVGYSPNKDNIGNLKKETYLEAMFKVYSEMFRVLKPNGKAIVVVKPFIRNKKVVDLPWHTWLLMQRVGFQLAKLYKLRLKQESFWRILYYKNHPEVPRLRHEYVLVCRKPTDGEQSEASSAPQVNSIEFLAESLRRERVNKTLSAFLRSLRGRRPA